MLPPRANRQHSRGRSRSRNARIVSARLPSIRCPEHGDVALTPSWASDDVSLSGPDPRRKHRPARRHARARQLASRPSTRELRATPAASSSLAARRLSSRAPEPMPGARRRPARRLPPDRTCCNHRGCRRRHPRVDIRTIPRKSESRTPPRSRAFESGRSWTRTRDLFLIRQHSAWHARTRQGTVQQQIPARECLSPFGRGLCIRLCPGRHLGVSGKCPRLYGARCASVEALEGSSGSRESLPVSWIIWILLSGSSSSDCSWIG